MRNGSSSGSGAMAFVAPSAAGRFWTGAGGCQPHGPVAAAMAVASASEVRTLPRRLFAEQRTPRVVTSDAAEPYDTPPRRYEISIAADGVIAVAAVGGNGVRACAGGAEAGGRDVLPLPPHEHYDVPRPLTAVLTVPRSTAQSCSRADASAVAAASAESVRCSAAVGDAPGEQGALAARAPVGVRAAFFSAPVMAAAASSAAPSVASSRPVDLPAAAAGAVTASPDASPRTYGDYRKPLAYVDLSRFDGTATRPRRPGPTRLPPCGVPAIRRGSYDEAVRRLYQNAAVAAVTSGGDYANLSCVGGDASAVDAWQRQRAVFPRRASLDSQCERIDSPWSQAHPQPLPQLGIAATAPRRKPPPPAPLPAPAPRWSQLSALAGSFGVLEPGSDHIVAESHHGSGVQRNRPNVPPRRRPAAASPDGSEAVGAAEMTVAGSRRTSPEDESYGGQTGSVRQLFAAQPTAELSDYLTPVGARPVPPQAACRPVAAAVRGENAGNNSPDRSVRAGVGGTDEVNYAVLMHDGTLAKCGAGGNATSRQQSAVSGRQASLQSAVEYADIDAIATAAVQKLAVVQARYRQLQAEQCDRLFAQKR